MFVAFRFHYEGDCHATEDVFSGAVRPLAEPHRSGAQWRHRQKRMPQRPSNRYPALPLIPQAAAGLVLLLLTTGAWAQFGPKEPYTIVADRRATYTNLAIEGQGRYRKITTERRGPSGVGYSLREYDCEQGRARYLATGDTREELARVKPDKWSPVIDGSIASYIGGQACHDYKPARSQRKR